MLILWPQNSLEDNLKNKHLDVLLIIKSQNKLSWHWIRIFGGGNILYGAEFLNASCIDY